MSFVDKVLKTSSVPIHFLSSKDEYGRECYFIIICAKHKLDSMLSGSSLVNPEEFGHVIDSGFGKRPPESICNMLKEKYNFDIDAV